MRVAARWQALAKFYGKGKVEAFSAGAMPSSEVRSVMVEVMKKKGCRRIDRNLLIHKWFEKLMW